MCTASISNCVKTSCLKLSLGRHSRIGLVFVYSPHSEIPKYKSLFRWIVLNFYCIALLSFDYSPLPKYRKRWADAQCLARDWNSRINCTPFVLNLAELFFNCTHSSSLTQALIFRSSEVLLIVISNNHRKCEGFILEDGRVEAVLSRTRYEKRYAV